MAAAAPGLMPNTYASVAGGLNGEFIKTYPKSLFVELYKHAETIVYPPEDSDGGRLRKALAMLKPVLGEEFQHCSFQGTPKNAKDEEIRNESGVRIVDVTQYGFDNKEALFHRNTEPMVRLLTLRAEYAIFVSSGTFRLLILINTLYYPMRSSPAVLTLVKEAVQKTISVTLNLSTFSHRSLTSNEEQYRVAMFTPVGKTLDVVAPDFISKYKINVNNLKCKHGITRFSCPKTQFAELQSLQLPVTGIPTHVLNSPNPMMNAKVGFRYDNNLDLVKRNKDLFAVADLIVRFTKGVCKAYVTRTAVLMYSYSAFEHEVLSNLSKQLGAFSVSSIETEIPVPGPQQDSEGNPMELSVFFGNSNPAVVELSSLPIQGSIPVLMIPEILEIAAERIVIIEFANTIKDAKEGAFNNNKETEEEILRNEQCQSPTMMTTLMKKWFNYSEPQLKTKKHISETKILVHCESKKRATCLDNFCVVNASNVGAFLFSAHHPVNQNGGL